MAETGVGEIGTLERAFNSMGSSLEANRDELRRLVDEQSALRRVATLVAQTSSPFEVFETVTREVGLLCAADLARMERYEPDGTVTGVAGWSRSADPELAVGTQFALEGFSIAALVRRSGSPVRVDDFAEKLRRLGYFESPSTPRAKGEYRILRKEGLIEIYLHDFDYPTEQFKGTLVRIGLQGTADLDERPRQIVDMM